MEGIEMAARFSAAPNSLGLCGPEGFNMADKVRLRAQLKRFLAPYTYLSLIAKANKRKPFDYDVVEAFWLGNRLLDNVNRSDVAKAIKTKFTGKGKLSPLRAKALADALPERVYLHHSFHVYYIGSISGVLEGKPKLLDKCRISWGRITHVGKSTIRACSKPAVCGKGEAHFSHLKAATWKKSPLSTFKKGGIACSHWGVAVMQITKKQEKNLEKYTMKNLALYSARPRGG